MKFKITIICVLLALVSTTTSAQSKKELGAMIQNLENEITTLKNDVTNLKNENVNLSDKLKNEENKVANQETTIKLLQERIGLIEKSNSLSITDIEKKLSEMEKKLVATIKADPNAIITDPQNEEDSIISVIQQYYTAKRLEDRLPFVYNPEKVKPLMQKYYTDGINRKTIDKTELSIPGQNYKVGDKFFVTGFGIVAMRKTKEGFKIDWEATEGYNATTLDNYHAEKRTERVLWRMKVYSLKEGWGRCYKNFLSIGDLNFPKNSDIAKKLSRMNGKRIIVEIQGREEYCSESDRYEYRVHITRIVSEDWFGE